MKRARSSITIAILAGLLLGAIVHLVVVLRVPQVAERDAFGRLSELAGGDHARLVPLSANGVQTLPLPDPAVATAVCAYDLSSGPARVTAAPSGYFQSLSFHGRGGGVFYALTDRAAIRGAIEITLMTRRQLDEALAEEDEEEEVARDIRIVSPTPQGLVVVRALAPFPSLSRREVQAAEAVTCKPVEAKASS